MKKLPSIIHILIEEYNEDWTTYFLWTSPELEGLLIEANTIDDLKEKAPWVISMYIKSANEIEKEKKDAFIKKILSSKTLNIFYNWEWKQQLTLA